MALLPIFQLLGTNYKRKTIITSLADSDVKFDLFSKIDFLFPAATASIKVAKGAKSEGALVVTGTEAMATSPRLGGKPITSSFVSRIPAKTSDSSTSSMEREFGSN